MKQYNEIQAGLFITLGIVLFIIVIWALGQRRQIFERQEKYTVTFKDVQGLSEGAPVRLGGISVGRVESIGFSKDNQDPLLYVRLLINNKYLERIREDSVVSIETQGLLGDKFINLKSGGNGTMLEPGSTLKSNEPADIASVLSKAGEVVDNTVEISATLNEFIAEIKDSALTDIAASAKNLAAILKEVQEGDGVLHSLIYSNGKGSSMLSDLEKTSKNIAEITAAVKTGDGLLNALVYDPDGKKTIKALTEASENLAITADHISTLAAEIQKGDGLLHSLVYDTSPEGIADIITRLSNTAKNLEEASKALASGEGTLGALLVDSQLYDDAVEITDGAKRSFILREAVRSTLD